MHHQGLVVALMLALTLLVCTQSVDNLFHTLIGLSSDGQLSYLEI